MLVSSRLEFEHPISHEQLVFQAAEPSHMRNFIQWLQERERGEREREREPEPEPESEREPERPREHCYGYGIW